MNTDTPKIKKPRAAAHKWSLFYHLKAGDYFYLGKDACKKSGCFSGVSVVEGKSGETVWVTPWTRVRTNEPLHPLRKSAPPEHVTPAPIDITGPTC